MSVCYFYRHLYDDLTRIAEIPQTENEVLMLISCFSCGSLIVASKINYGDIFSDFSPDASKCSRCYKTKDTE